MSLLRTSAAPVPSSLERSELPARWSVGRGAHRVRGERLCPVEAAAAALGVAHSDHPSGVDPVLAAVWRTAADCLSEPDRQPLAAGVARLAGAGELSPARWVSVAVALAEVAARTCLAGSAGLAVAEQSLGLAGVLGHCGDQVGPAVRRMLQTGSGLLVDPGEEGSDPAGLAWQAVSASVSAAVALASGRDARAVQDWAAVAVSRALLAVAGGPGALTVGAAGVAAATVRSMAALSLA